MSDFNSNIDTGSWEKSVLISTKKTDFIELNKFSSVHDGVNFIFCKTDFILNEFEVINKMSNDVVLITGNSDYAITDDFARIMTKNIIKWYGQNILTFHEKIEPIPLGIENKNESYRHGHGIGYYDRVDTKERLLNRDLNISPFKKIYANFDINTNFSHRNPVKHLCENSPHIEWQPPILSLEEFFDRILDYEMIVCPAGNGVDTHRLWEVLYSNRIPITVKVGDFKIYEMYKKFPIIILDKIDDLKNYSVIEQKYNEIKKNNYNKEFLDFNYWVKLITKFNE